MKKYVAMMALGAALTMGACDQVGTPAQIHPTHGGPNGECIEFDDEPCDDDPFDTDDLFDKPKSSSKPAPKPSPAKSRGLLRLGDADG